MRRASHSITLVLVSSSLIMYGCGGPTGYEEVPTGPAAGTVAETLPGNPTTYKYVAPNYYPAGSVTRVPRSSSWWGGSSRSTGMSHSSHSSSVSRGGFGSSSHSFSSHSSGG